MELRGGGFKVKVIGPFFVVGLSLCQSVTVTAAPRTYREFRQEQAQSAEEVCQDMRQSLQRVKAAADALSQTSSAVTNNLNQGLASLDARQLQRKLSALPPQERYEAAAFYRRLQTHVKRKGPTHAGYRESERMELSILRDELQKNVAHLDPEPGSRPKIEPVKTPKPKKGK
jgi:hypothetical protein